MKEELRDIYDQAGIAEKDLRIQKVQVTRGEPQMRIACERKPGAIEPDRQTRWESLLKGLLGEWEVSFAYTDLVPEKPAAVQPKPKDHDVEAPIPENGVLYGRPIKKNETTSICSIEENESDTVIVGRIVSAELRDEWTREGKKPNCRVQLNLTDFTDSIYCSINLNEE